MSRLREVCFIAVVFIAVFLFLSVITYHNTDPSWSHVGQTQAQNLAGKVGAWVADILLVVSGYVAYVFPVLVGLFAWRLLFNSSCLNADDESFDGDENELRVSIASFWLRLFGFAIFMLSASALVSAYVTTTNSLPAGAGGISGSLISAFMVGQLNITGATLILCAVVLSGLTLSLGVSWITIFDKVGQHTFKGLLKICSVIKQYFVKYLEQRKANQVQKQADKAARKEAEIHVAVEQEKLKQQQLTLDQFVSQKVPEAAVGAPNINAAPEAEADESPSFSLFNFAKTEKQDKHEEQKSAKQPAEKTKKPSGKSNSYSKEAISFELLNSAQASHKNNISSVQLTMLSQEVEQRLLDFGIKVEVVGVNPGPVVTRFELSLSPGMKAGRISNLSTDLARSLSAVSVRVVEVIPGKSVIGLEIPNQARELVSLREVLESKQYQQAKSPVSLALGKDISGHPVVVDLAKMPHLLVAGTTGSGKSVGVNAMLLSLLYKATPEEVRLILVDPKMLELSVYDGIPHLLTPVVTDMKEAANALRWCVAEMEKRYKLMATLGVRNLAGYNDKVKKAKAQKESIKAPEWYANQCEDGCLSTLPTIVVVIDEFADMIMVVGKKVEQLIARIAQKARAAGIHLILATQRPSVNVITGLIKANIPTRIAFQVSSKIDSRTILDQQGAQQLLGHGDMLYLAPGSGVPVRVHVRGVPTVFIFIKDQSFTVSSSILSFVVYCIIFII